MTDVPPDNGASGLPPAMPPEPPFVRRSNFSEPPPGSEPPRFDDDALADAMAAEVAPYTAPISLPKLPVPPRADALVAPVPSAPAAPAEPAGPAVPAVPAYPTAAPDVLPAPFVAPLPPAAADVPVAPVTTWDGRPVAEEAAAPPNPGTPAPFVPVPAPVESAPTPVPAASPGDDGEPSEEELRRALGGASTLETIERLETELKHISNGEPTILPVTATPAAGVSLGDIATGPAPTAQAEPASAEPAPTVSAPAWGAPTPAPVPTEAAPVPAPVEPTGVPAEPAPAAGTAWPFPPPGEPEPEPALDHPAPGHFFPEPFQPIHPVGVAEPIATEPAAADTVAAEPAIADPASAEPAAADPASAEPAAAGPTESVPTEPARAETDDAPTAEAWSLRAPDPTPVLPLDPQPESPAAPDPDPLAWLAPPAGSFAPPPPESAVFPLDTPAAEPTPQAFPPEPQVEQEFAPPMPTPPDKPAEPFAPEPPDPGSYAPYPFEVDPRLIDPVAAEPTAEAAVPEPTAEAAVPEPQFAQEFAPPTPTPTPTPAPTSTGSPAEPFAPEAPNPASYAPYPFEVDPSLIDPVAAAPAAEAAAPEPQFEQEFAPPAPTATSADPLAEPFAPELPTPGSYSPEPPDPSSYAPYPFEIDPSLIDPVAAATVPESAPLVAAPSDDPVAEEPGAAPAVGHAPADNRTPPDESAPPVGAASPADSAPAAEEPATAPESPWWAVTEPADGAWDLAAPAPAAPDLSAPAPQLAAAEPAAPDPAAAVGFDPAPVAPPVAAPAEVDPALGFPTPYSTEPPVGPESPDWLDAPPPVFSPPDLVEPPAFVDSPPNAALDPVAPITANTMAALPTPLPTYQPNIADRAELPPPPGYEDIPIMSSDVAAAPAPVPSSAFFPAAAPAAAAPAAAPIDPPVVAAPVATPLLAAPPLTAPPLTAPPVVAPPSIGSTSPSTEPSGLDHDDDDVIDEVDRVAGMGAVPISSVGTIDSLAPPSAPIATVRLSESQQALVDEQPKQPPAFEVEAVGPEPTPLDMRAGRAARLFWLWFAANSSVLSMGLGAVLLATGMSLRQSIVAALAGVAISFLPLGLGTLAGKWSGQPTMIVSRATFGHAGNILPALLAVLTRVLWGGVLLWLLATAVAQVLVGSGLDAGLGTTVWQLVGLVVGFVIATVVAVFGYGFVAKLQLVVSIVSGLLILGSAALTYQHLDFAKALTVPDGNWILVVAGAALVFSVVGLAWVHSSSDLARYQRPGSSGAASMLWATFGATLPPFLLVLWGSMLAASDPALGKQLTANPLAAIASLLPAWYPAPLLAFAALGLLSGAVVTMYSGGFALQALGLKLRRSMGTLISAILVLAVSAALIFVVTDFSSLVRGLILTIAVPVAAWAGIFAAEMMIRTRRFHTPSLLAPGGVYPQLRPLNFLALIVISVIGLGLVSSSIPGLEWEGFLYRLAGIGPKDVLASSEAGVFVALLLGILVPLVGGIPSIRRQERTSAGITPPDSAFAPPLLD